MFKKTKLVFHPYSSNIENNINENITILDVPVGYTNSYLYLGIDIDRCLTFKQYYGNMFKKISYKLSLLRRIRYMITYKAALDITKTMFCSIIDYGNIFISSCNDGDLNDVQVLQNHALRCCCNVKTHTEVHISDLHISTKLMCKWLT